MRPAALCDGLLQTPRASGDGDVSDKCDEFPSRRLLRLAGSRCRYSIPPPHANPATVPEVTALASAERTHRKHSFLYCCVLIFRAWPRDDVLQFLHAWTCLRSCCPAMCIHVTIHMSCQLIPSSQVLNSKGSICNVCLNVGKPSKFSAAYSRKAQSLKHKQIYFTINAGTESNGGGYAVHGSHQTYLMRYMEGNIEMAHGRI
jgi:hypothetical protein